VLLHRGADLVREVREFGVGARIAAAEEGFDAFELLHQRAPRRVVLADARDRAAEAKQRVDDFGRSNVPDRAGA
jgi:hypothetical protein